MSQNHAAAEYLPTIPVCDDPAGCAAAKERAIQLMNSGTVDAAKHAARRAGTTRRALAAELDAQRQAHPPVRGEISDGRRRSL